MAIQKVILFLLVQLILPVVPVKAQGTVISQYSGQLNDYRNGRGASVNHVHALLHEKAELPCDLSPPVMNDTVVLVVWYKNQHSPIYSYDTRRADNNGPAKWHDDSLLDQRVDFRTITQPSILTITPVTEADEAEYWCRIDYLRSPTKNVRVKLSVIVPPNKPTIIDGVGKEVSLRAGPYKENQDLKLTCFVTGGKPPPVVQWWRDGTLIDSMETKNGFENVKSKQLIVRKLQRSDQHATFTCQASNNNISQAVSTATTIEIHLRPLTVEILSSNQPFSADRRYEIPCQAMGSRPPAKISWWMDNEELLNHTQNDSEDGNISTSTLSLLPTRLDNGKSLTCRANNPMVKGGVEEATLKLNVFYIPILHLSLGSNLNPDDIEEGDDAYFECKVNANPWAYKVVWKHNGQVMQHNQKSGIIMSNSDLALQNVNRQQAGNYTCIASNVEGDGDSNTVPLKIMYKPLCRLDQKRVYGVARHERANVSCEVDSYPPPLSFKWSFNNTAETIDVPQTRYRSGTDEHFRSVLTYTPVSELDYGTVMCWAENTAGRQREPCVFHIIAAGKPDAPYNCSLLNQTTESLEVECMEGFDGGQPQYFLLEVYDQQTSVLQANVSAKFPLFTVSGLDSGKILRMMVYAANSKGRSEAVLLEGFTLKVAEKQTGTPTQIELAPILGILIGVVTALLLVTVLIVGAMKVRGSHRDPSQPSRPGLLQIKDKVTLPLRSESEDLFEKDDKNPDVVPANKDSDYQLGSAAQTPGLNNAVHSIDYSTPPSHVTPLAEAYIARDRAYAAQPVNNEVTYAELSLSRPNTLDTTPGYRSRDEPTIYAQIDHGRRPPHAASKASLTSPLVSPVSVLFPANKPTMYHREVVTVRTPLMGCQQESCV